MIAVPDGGVWLALCRGAAVAALLSAWGVLVFDVAMAPAAGLHGAARSVLQRRLWRAEAASLGAAVLSLLVWLVVQSGAFAVAAGPDAALDAVPTVLGFTRFGHLTIAQLLCAAAAWVTARRGAARVGLVCIGGAVVLHGLRTHAATSGSAWLLVSEIAHLAAAGAWLGSLLPLWLTLRALPADQAAVFAGRYGRLGAICVAILAATAVVQSSQLIGSWAALAASAYGRWALLKLGLFGLLVVCAVLNRYWLGPRLGAGHAPALQAVSVCLAVETALGVAVVLAAGMLAQSMPPDMRM